MHCAWNLKTLKKTCSSTWWHPRFCRGHWLICERLNASCNQSSLFFNPYPEQAVLAFCSISSCCFSWRSFSWAWCLQILSICEKVTLTLRPKIDFQPCDRSRALVSRNEAAWRKQKSASAWRHPWNQLLALRAVNGSGQAQIGASLLRGSDSTFPVLL